MTADAFNIMIYILLIAIAVMYTIMSIVGAVFEHEDGRSCAGCVVGAVICFAAAACIFASMLSYVYANKQTELAKASYNVSNIDCVYPDNGNSADAEVQYYINGSIRKLSARELGYCDVVVDNTVKKPDEKLTPSGKELIIPESYLRYKS